MSWTEWQRAQSWKRHLHELKYQHSLAAQWTRSVELDHIAVITDGLQHINLLQTTVVGALHAAWLGKQ